MDQKWARVADTIIAGAAEQGIRLYVRDGELRRWGPEPTESLDRCLRQFWLPVSTRLGEKPMTRVPLPVEELRRKVQDMAGSSRQGAVAKKAGAFVAGDRITPAIRLAGAKSLPNDRWRAMGRSQHGDEQPFTIITRSGVPVLVPDCYSLGEQSTAAVRTELATGIGQVLSREKMNEIAAVFEYHGGRRKELDAYIAFPLPDAEQLGPVPDPVDDPAGLAAVGDRDDQSAGLFG